MNSSVLKAFIAGIGILLLAWLFNVLLQDKKIYDKTIGAHITQIQKVNGEMTAPNKAFEKINNDSLIRWDAVHYLFIRDNHYDQNKTGDYIFAFFPLFSVIWEITHLSNIGICILNFLLFISGLILLFRSFDISFGEKNHLLKFIVLLSLPGSVVFFIPYTESLFFFTTCLAFYGMMKKRYLLYFTGMLLCSMTRPAALIICMAILSKDVYMFVTTKEYYSLPKKIFLNILPLIIGTLLISLVQYKFDPSRFFHFYHVNIYWDHQLQVPHNLRDWSHEGYSMNVALVFLLIPLLFFLLLKNVFVKKDTADPKDDIFNFSMFYMLGASFFILLFQGGNLHGLFRYVMCTPFFFAFCIIGFERFAAVASAKKLGLLLFTFLPALFTYSFSTYLTVWEFYSMGFFLIFLNFIFLFYTRSMGIWPVRIFFCFVVLVNTLWNVYMLNCYLNDGWIFT